MKNLFKILAALIPVAKSIYRKIKGAKDAKAKKRMRDALRNADADTVRDMLLGD